MNKGRMRAFLRKHIEVMSLDRSGSVNKNVRHRTAHRVSRSGHPSRETLSGESIQTNVLKRIPSFWIYALLLVLAVYTAVVFVKQETEMQMLRRAMTEMEVRIERETHNNQQLQERKQEISSEDSVERIAREVLGYVKDGERIFVDTNR